MMKMEDACGRIFQLTSDTHTVFLPIPKYAGETGNLSNKLMLFDFWLNERDVVNIEIKNESITLSGIIFSCVSENYCCFPICFPLCFSTYLYYGEIGMESIATKFLNIHEMMNKNEEVIITELNDCVNAVYIIKDFTYGTIKRSPFAYTWQLTLEYKRSI